MQRKHQFVKFMHDSILNSKIKKHLLIDSKKWILVQHFYTRKNNKFIHYYLINVRKQK